MLFFFKIDCNLFERIMKTGIIVLMYFIAHFNLISQCDLQNIDLPVSEENIKFLSYYEYTNLFENALFESDYGEFKIITSNEQIKLYPEPEIEWRNRKIIEGDTNTGIDQRLYNNSKTNVFTIPDSSSISFYRRVVLANTCENGEGGGFPEDNPNGENDIWEQDWDIGNQNLADEMEFVVEIKEDASDLILQTIDSIGVVKNPINPNSKYVYRYGTEPDNWERIVPIDSSLWGKQAYIAIKPKRLSKTTPFGMRMRYVETVTNLSFIMDKAYHTFKSSISDSCFEQIYYTLKDSLVYLNDSVKVLTGRTNKYINRAFFTHFSYSREYLDYFYNRYFQMILDTLGAKYWIDTDTNAINVSNKSYVVNAEKGEYDQEGKFNKIVISKIYPNPLSIDETKINLVIFSNENYENLEFVIFNLMGEKVFTLKGQSITKGKMERIINLNNKLSSGIYNVGIFDQNQGMIHSKKFIVE